MYNVINVSRGMRCLTRLRASIPPEAFVAILSVENVRLQDKTVFLVVLKDLFN